PKGPLGFLFMQTILFIDGRNFISKISYILNPENSREKQINFATYDFSGLLSKVLTGIELEKKIFYLGKLEQHKETEKKSNDLIEKQRLLKLHLEQQGFEVILAGRVRGHTENCPKGHEVLTFKEKGVDVRMAVDMITAACNKDLKTAIIGSSDSDLQPVVRELRNQRIERVYLGFESQPNKGLTATTNRTILIRNSELKEFLRK
ncbi:MAG: NYN domain-containing protein, partial [Candidatus Taylorbacteria bacterium]|nr:NYN domain-containing protein [Candidatus Taylorbacteria bacterium]